MGFRSRQKRARRLLPPSERASTLARAIGNPSFERREPLVPIEIPPPPTMEAGLINQANSYLRCYRLGECSVIVTKGFGRWHLSIAHTRRYPTWDEIAAARYLILPEDVVMGVLLPPKAEYVNINPNCFQMKEIRDPELRFGADD